MKKRGQVTIFIIVAIVIVLGVGLFFVFSGANKVDSSAGALDYNQDVSDYMDDCLKQGFSEGIYLVGLQGGYVDPETAGEDFLVRQLGENEAWVPVYFDSGEFSVPTVGVLESELETLATTVAHICLLDLEENRDDVEWDDVDSTSVEVEDGFISVNVRVPVSSEISGETNVYDDFSSKINFDYKGYYEKAMKFVEQQQNSANMIPLSLFANVAEAEGFVFDVTNINDNEVYVDLVFDVNDEDALKLPGSGEIVKYVWSFVLRYE